MSDGGGPGIAACVGDEDSFFRNGGVYRDGLDGYMESFRDKYVGVVKLKVQVEAVVIVAGSSVTGSVSVSVSGCERAR